MIMSDNGAEIIKVEPPEGDFIRSHPASIMWNRGKKSISLDLKSEQDLGVAHYLAERADVVLENFRPGVADRLGIGHEALSEKNPSLIYCSITGFGPRGAYAGLKGYEGIVAAKIGRFAGEEGMMGGGWREEGPIFFALPVLSYGAAHLATHGILAALLARRRTGWGQHVQTSLLQAAMVFGSSAFMVRVGEEAAFTPAKRARGTPHENMAAGYQIGQTSDGRWIQIASTTVRVFRSFMRAMGMESVYDDPRFHDMPYNFPTPEDRVRVLAEIQARLKTKPLDEWMRLFDADGDAGAEPFLTTQEAMSHPQFVHNKHVIEVMDPVFGRTQQIAPLAQMSDTPAAVQGPAPKLGEHTREVLAAVRAGQDPWSAAQEPLPPPRRQEIEHPLGDLTILELANHIAGPFGVTLLAELGARVIKIEPPEGDLLRRIMDAAVKTIQGKQSIAIDLKTDTGKSILHKLVEKADVLVHNFRPGVEERLGIDYGGMAEINPRLVYVFAAAYGSSGPRAGRPVFGPGINAITGAGYYVNGEGNPPTSGVHADPSSALGVATASLLGLYARERTGRGQHIETTMLNSTSYALSDDFIRYEGKPPRRLPDQGQHGFDALYRLYESSDGWVFLACRDESEWKTFCQATGREDLLKDPRFSSASARDGNDAALIQEIASIFGARKTDEWEQLLLARNVACVRADGQVFREFFVKDRAVRENDLITTTSYVDYYPHKDQVVDFGEYLRHGNTVHFSRMTGVTGPPCGIGDYTQAIMKELGYSEEQTEKLKDEGVVTWGIGWAARG